MSDVITFLSTIGTLERFGAAGFVAYLCAFGAVLFGLMDGNATNYRLLNILAAMLRRLARSSFATQIMKRGLAETPVGGGGMALCRN